MKLVKQYRTPLVLIAMGIMLIMVNLDLSAANLALAPIARDFHASLSQLQWIGNALVIISATLMIIAGRIADLFGKKRWFMIGGLILIFASVLAGIAPNTTLLISGRLIQGIGMAIAFPLSVSLAFMAVTPEKRGFVLGYTGGMAGLAQAIGPSVGGLIIHFLSWRWIFLFNVPIGLISLGIAWLACEKDIVPTKKETLDYNGAILLFIPLVLLIYIFNEFNNISLNFIFYASLIILLIFSMFVVHEKRTPFSLIDFNVFRNRNFLLINLFRTTIGFVVFAFLFMIGIYLQNILSYSALQTGILLLFFSCASGITSPIVGKLTDKVGAPPLLNIATICIITSLAILFFHPTIITWHQCILPFCLMGIGFGIIMPCSTFVALNSFDESKMGVVSGIFFTNACLGSALGISITGSLLSYVSLSNLHQFITTNKIVLSTEQNSLLQHVVTGADSITKLKGFFPEIMLQHAQDFFIHGFELEMLLCLVLATIALSSLWLLRKNIPKN